VACTLGVKYIGYNMIAFGITNFLFSVIVGVVARRVAAEALVGVATVLQLGLAVFLLVWIPDRHLTPVFFAVSALWGMCDAIWQIECNCKCSFVCVSVCLRKNNERISMKLAEDNHYHEQIK